MCVTVPRLSFKSVIRTLYFATFEYKEEQPLLCLFPSSLWQVTAISAQLVGLQAILRGRLLTILPRIRSSFSLTQMGFEINT